MGKTHCARKHDFPAVPWRVCPVNGHQLCYECYLIAVSQGLVEGPPVTRKCKACGETRPLTEFHFANKTGARRHQCKTCQTKAERERYKRKRE